MYAQPEMWASAGKDERGPALASNAPTNVMADASNAPDDQGAGRNASDKKAAVSAVPEQKASSAKASDAKTPEPSGVSAALHPAVSPSTAGPAKLENDVAEPAVEPGFGQTPAVAVPSSVQKSAPSAKPPAAPKAPAVGPHVSAVSQGRATRSRHQFAQSNAVDETFFAFN